MSAGWCLSYNYCNTRALRVDKTSSCQLVSILDAPLLNTTNLNMLLILSQFYIFLYLDSTLTPTNLLTTLTAVRNWSTLGLSWRLQLPDPVEEEVQQQTSDATQQKKMLLERWLQDHPTPSWAVVAEALYWIEEHGVLEQVKKTYITGMLGWHRVCVVGQKH